jgi:hypothetical protein
VPGAECECGCEATIHRFDRYGRRTRWVLGHAPRGREGLGKPVPLEPFACYLEEQLHEIDPVEALALLHGVKREDLMAVLNRRGEEVPRKLVQRALWTRGVGSTGAQRGRRPGIPTFYELYPGDARSKICPGCGGGKAPHAQMCKLCRRSADPSYMKPPTHRRRVSDELLAEAREIHERTNNYHAAARAIFSRTAYKSIASCAQALRGYLHPRVL